MKTAETGAGERRTKVRFERAVTAKSGLGVKTPTSWTVIQLAWAKPMYGRGEERRTAAAEGATALATFRTRSTAALRTVTALDRMVFVHGGAVWEISAPPVPFGTGELDFTCKAVKG